MFAILAGSVILGGCNHISHQLCSGTVTETVVTSKQTLDVDIATTGSLQTEAADTIQPFRLATRFFN
jgi:deoxyhypusine synthase